jgi:16S rRNA (adenine1518-N6/adenine1519-N6)-dimethyltransferase
VPRRLGQHFLRDPAILDRIVEALSPTTDDVVLEIGPGDGTLTRRLASRVGHVVTIEKDAALVRRLREGPPSLPANVTVVEGDALRLDWHDTVLTSAIGHRPSAIGHRPAFKIIGNIPYYITSPLIDLALRPPPPAVVVFLVQREVADRVTAVPGSKTFGALSVGVQAVARAERVFIVRAGAFVPPPRVDSAVLRLTPRSDALVTDAERGPFRTFVVALFGQRRKQIGRSLRDVAGLTAEGAAATCREVGVDPGVRPESLAPERLAALFRACPR